MINSLISFLELFKKQKQKMKQIIPFSKLVKTETEQYICDVSLKVQKSFIILFFSIKILNSKILYFYIKKLKLILFLNKSNMLMFGLIDCFI